MPNPEAVIDLVANRRRFDSQMGAVERILQRVKAKMQAVSRAAKYMLVAQVAAIGVVVAAAAKQEKAEAKLAAVLKATGNAAELSAKQIMAHARALQQVTIYGDETIINMQALLATFKEIKGDVFRQATEAIIDMSAAMGTDLQSSVVQMGKALNDPIVGVTALARVGVTFTKQQKEQIKAFVEGGKVAKAQGIILRELQSEFGGVAEAIAKTSGGALAQMKNELGDVAELIGAAVIPAILKAAKAIKEWTVGAKEWVETHVDLIAKLAKVTIGVTALMVLLGPMTRLLGLVTFGFKAGAFAIAQFGAAITAVQISGITGAITILIAKLGVLTAGFGAAAASAWAFASNPLVIAIALVAGALVKVALAARQAKKELAEAEKLSLRMAKAIRQQYGTSIEDIEAFSDAQAKTLSKEARDLRTRIELLGEQRKAMEDQLASFGRRVPLGDLPIVRAIQENIAIAGKQIETYTRMAEAAEAAAKARMEAAKQAAKEEAESYGVAAKALDKKIAAMHTELDVLGLMEREVAALKLVTEGYNEEQLKEIMAIWDKVAAEKAAIAATEKAAEASAAAADAIRDRTQSLDDEAGSIRKQIRALKEGVSLREIELFDLQNVEQFKDRATEILALMRQQRGLEKQKADEDKAAQAKPIATGFETMLGALTRISAAAAAPRTGEEAQLQTARNTSRLADTQEQQLNQAKIGNQTLGQVAASLADRGPGVATFSE